MDAVSDFVKIDPENISAYFHLFQDYPYLENYINYAFDYLEPEIWISAPEQLAAAYFYTAPAYFLTGNPNAAEVDQIFASMPEGSWILASPEAWKPHLQRFFGETLFAANTLQPGHIRNLKIALPAGLQLVQIGDQQIQQEDSLFYRDVLCRFFAQINFLEDGLGFCVMDGDTLAGFAASNYPIRDNGLEVYIRVLDNHQYRQKGLGMTLCATLIEYCLEHGIEPVWDAANQVSAHMAQKLGYTLVRKCEMYHIA